MKRTFTRFYVLVLLLSALIACSPETGPGNATELASDTVTTASPPTTSTTKPTTTSTTEPEPTTTTINDETAVLELHAYFTTEFLAGDSRDHIPEERNAELAELAVDPLLTRSTDSYNAMLAANEYSVGKGYVSHPTEVRITGDSAVVIDCSQGTGARYNNNGTLITPADDFYKFREFRYQRVNGKWMIQDIFSGGDLRCDPQDV